MNELVIVGKVKTAKGLEGYLKIFCDINLLKLKDKIVLKRGMIKDLFSIEDVIQENGPNYLLKVKGIETLEKAKEFIQADLMILNKHLEKVADKPLKSEILGMKVVDKNLGFLGEIEEIIKSPANDIFSFTYNGKEILIPDVKEFVLSIDRDKKIIEVDLKEVEQFES